MGSKVFLLVFLLMGLLYSSAPATDIPAENRNQDLIVATQEMQRANYFTFVMLINMAPPDTRLQGNVTFLMPNDKTLANTVIPEGDVPAFLLRHSIPSSLLFGTLEKLPTGTTIPSSLPNYMLRISNNGRRDFVLNNVKIISPNICVAGASIRCHGVNGVLSEETTPVNNSTTVPSPSCSVTTDPIYSPPNPSPPLFPSSPPPIDNLSPPTLIAPTPIEADVGPQKSGSSSHLLSKDGSLNFAAGLMLSLAGILL